MLRIDLSFLLLGVLCLLIGLTLGIGLSVAHDFQLALLHAALNLVGFASLSVFGLTYKLYPALQRSRLAVPHLAMSSLGALLFPFRDLRRGEPRVSGPRLYRVLARAGRCSAVCDQFSPERGALGRAGLHRPRCTMGGLRVLDQRAGLSRLGTARRDMGLRSRMSAPSRAGGCTRLRLRAAFPPAQLSMSLMTWITRNSAAKPFGGWTGAAASGT